MSTDQTTELLPTIANMVTAWINAKSNEDRLRQQLAEAEGVTAHELCTIGDAAEKMAPRGTSFVVRAWGNRADQYDIHTVIIDLNASGSVNVDFISDMSEKIPGK